MRSILIIAGLVCALTSCVSTHRGNLSSSSIGKPVRYEDIAYGVSQENRYFGLGGNNQDALVLEARRELVKSRPLSKTEEFTNYTIDFKIRRCWPFYTQTKVTMSADVVKLLTDTTNAQYSNNYQNKLLGKVSKNGLFSIGDSVLDSHMNKWKLLSIENSDKVRVIHQTSTNKIQTRKMSINDIFIKDKKYNGFQTGDFFGHQVESAAGTQYHVARVVAVGIKSVLIRNKNKISRVSAKAK